MSTFSYNMLSPTGTLTNLPKLELEPISCAIFLLVVNWLSTSPLGCSRALMNSDFSTSQVKCLFLSRFLWLCSLLPHGIHLEKFHVCLLVVHFKVISRPHGSTSCCSKLETQTDKIPQISSSFLFWRESVSREHNGA